MYAKEADVPTPSRDESAPLPANTLTDGGSWDILYMKCEDPAKIVLFCSAM
jgi:hypothetical protein